MYVRRVQMSVDTSVGRHLPETPDHLCFAAKARSNDTTRAEPRPHGSGG